MTLSQTEFRMALLDASLPVPEGLEDGNAAPAGNRFSVYRNNVVLSLTEALATAFPVLRKLLGGATFERLANLYVRRHPPRSPLMMFYGEDMPVFLEDFEPLAHIGYLPDCSRLDLAIRRSYHAKDSVPFDASALQGDAAAAENLVVGPAPATLVIRSVWPLYDIWRFNTQPNAPKPRAEAQDVLITRPEFDPEVHLLPAGAAFWLDTLSRNIPFGDAFDLTARHHPGFDLSGALTLALTSGALTQDKTKDPA